MILRLILLAALCSATSACFSSSEKPKPARVTDMTYREEASPSEAQPLPWEIWRPFMDLEGHKLSNSSLIYGDELRQSGRNKSALDTYIKASKESLLPREAEAAALRLSGQYLVLDQADKALSSVGAYFRRRGLNEANVGLEFGLILAFSFGRSGDINQSLAWFARANTQAQRIPGGVHAATVGALLLLRSLPADKFESVANKWRADQFVNQLVGRERARRAALGYDQDDIRSEQPFWLGAAEINEPGQQGAISAVVDGETKLGVILSLSDRFGALGRDTRQGIDLALEANVDAPKIKIEARDVGVDTAAASAAVRELVAGSNVAMIIGPLLTEASVAAAGTARELGVPILSFSKSESFNTGQGVFRLGLTTTSQIEALVNAAYGDYKLTRFAIVYPQTAAGSEYLEAFRAKLAELNLPMILEISYSSSDESSMLEAVQRLESSTAEAVLIPDTIEVSTKLLSNIAPAVKRRMRPLGTALWDNPSKIAHSQAVFDRAIFVTPFFANSARPVVQQFVESYRGRFKTAPNFLAAQGFDAATLVINAIKRSKQERTPLAQALTQLPPYDGVTGAVSIDKQGEVRRALYVVEVTPTMFQEKMPLKATEGYNEVITAPSMAEDETAPLEGDQKVLSGY